MNSRLKPQVLEFDYAGCPAGTLFEKLNTSQRGLSEGEAKKRLLEYGYNEPARKKKRTILPAQNDS